MTARKYAPTCSFEGCERKHNARGLCGPHGAMARRGEPLRPIQGRTGPLAMEPAVRFESKVSRRPDGCWEWMGGKTLGGYGSFAPYPRTGGKALAHRWSYEQNVGPIPDGLDLDHLCRNRACVNPEHLEPVTREENIRRAFATRTTCTHGHMLTPENTYTRPGTNQRRCRTCMRERDRARATKRNAARRELRKAR